VLVRGILFDKDGTLFNFAEVWEDWASRLIAELSRGAAPLGRKIGDIVGFDPQARSFHPDSIIIAGTPNDIAAALNGHLPDWDSDEIIACANRLAQEVTLKSPVPLVPLLGDLRARGLKLGVATNDAEAPARAHLGDAGIMAFFDFLAGYDSGFGAKPAPGMLHEFCRVTGLAPKTVAMVGDSVHDMQAGRAAGMLSVAVLTGMADRDELAPHADVVLAHIGELPEWLENTR